MHRERRQCLGRLGDAGASCSSAISLSATDVRGSAADAWLLVMQALKDDGESPFLEPLVRSFLLGMGAACVLETGHIASKVRKVSYVLIRWVLLKSDPMLRPAHVRRR